MGDLKDIIDANWDGTITTQPTVYDGNMRNLSSVERGIISSLENDNDMVMDILDRNRFNQESHDGYIVEFASQTSKEDADNIKLALKKVFATFSPAVKHNIITWDGGQWIRISNARWEYRFIVILRKAGIQLF